MNDSDQPRIVTHDFPAWREKANFIFTTRLSEELGIADMFEWEQLWGREIESNTFELCCIPFFAYNLALGDIVETGSYETRKFVVNRLVSTAGHKTFRLFFRRSDRWDEIVDEIRGIGCTVEPRWRMSKLVAVDVAQEQERLALENYLKNLVEEVEWENGN